MTLPKELTAWATAYLAALPDIARLINQANFDLYHGPGNPAEDYPGFNSACTQISAALHSAPHSLWIDSNSGEVFEHEPDCVEQEAADACDESGQEFRCGCLDFVTQYEWPYIRRALVGVELAHHIT